MFACEQYIVASGDGLLFLYLPLKEHLLVSKALPVLGPHTTSTPLATYHFCMRSVVPVLRLKFGALFVRASAELLSPLFLSLPNALYPPSKHAPDPRRICRVALAMPAFFRIQGFLRR